MFSACKFALLLIPVVALVIGLLFGKRLDTDLNVFMNVYLYARHITSCFRGGLSEIGRQLVKAPLAAAISPYLISLTHPTRA